MLLEDGRVVPLDKKAREKVLEQVDSMSESALRCLALAYKTDLGPLSSYTGESHQVPLCPSPLLSPTLSPLSPLLSILSSSAFCGVGLRIAFSASARCALFP